MGHYHIFGGLTPYLAVNADRFMRGVTWLNGRGTLAIANEFWLSEDYRPNTWLKYLELLRPPPAVRPDGWTLIDLRLQISGA